MFSKQIIVAIILFILVGGVAAFMFYSRNQELSKQPETPLVTPTPTPVKMLTWTDEAGFSFNYPEGTVIDNHPDDNDNYANLTLSLPSKDTVQVIMSDNKYKNLVDWAGENSALDTILDGRPAKKISTDGLETIACIDNEVLVTITGKNIAEVVNSWVFIYPSPTVASKPAASTGDDGGNVLEEE